MSEFIRNVAVLAPYAAVVPTTVHLSKIPPKLDWLNEKHYDFMRWYFKSVWKQDMKENTFNSVSRFPLRVYLSESETKLSFFSLDTFIPSRLVQQSCTQNLDMHTFVQTGQPTGKIFVTEREKSLAQFFSLNFKRKGGGFGTHVRPHVCLYKRLPTHSEEGMYIYQCIT